jgi:hypothetical protein
MNSRLLSFSLSLNLVLLGAAGYWVVRSVGRTLPAAGPISQTNSTWKIPELAPPAVAAAPASVRWNELESKDYPTYVANLRKVGCPEPVLRRIIGAELKELYAQKVFVLVEEFHRDFWAIAARENVRVNFEKTLGRQVKALCQESDALLKQLVGEPSRELSSARPTSVPESRFTDFLPPAKQEQLRKSLNATRGGCNRFAKANFRQRKRQSSSRTCDGKWKASKPRYFHRKN